MKKIFSDKRRTVIVLVLCALIFIAGVPLTDDKTALQQLIAAFPTAVVSEAEQKISKQSLDSVWDELEKLSENNKEDSVSMSGTIRLYDNADAAGIKEMQHFTLDQQGDNQWFTLDSFVRIQMGPNLLMIDHIEREIVSQFSGKTDSLKQALGLSDPRKIKELLEKNGTLAELSKQNGLTVLTITPGTADPVNEYNIYYDSAYQIKKFTLSYTNVPYQDFLEDNKENEDSLLVSTVDNTKFGDSLNLDDTEINITEYVVEYIIKKQDKRSTVNFFDNSYYKVSESGDLNFKGKLLNYKKVKY